jgi:uncharacterized membrane protein YraQ (UPF0718 family)
LRHRTLSLLAFTSVFGALAHALNIAFGMTWEILWALVLGFALSAAVQAVVSKSEMTRLLPNDSARTIAIACGLGAASSSCSYAAVALARSIFRKGANFTAAIVFQFASTNLVIELGIVLGLLMGWQFALAEFVGGPIMIAFLAFVFRLTLSPQRVEEARVNADRGLVGAMEGHAAMDMSVAGGSILERLTSPRGFTGMSHYYVMDWASIWKDIVGGLLIAGSLAAWVPNGFWQSFFLVDHPVLAKLWGPLVGPLVAMLSFVCSIGNVPLAAVLWNGGISFGGVVAFIFADLIVLPILNIYRKYYGPRVSVYLLATFYATMVVAGLAVETLFAILGLIPDQRNAKIVEGTVSWNYTSILNIGFLVLSAVLVVRFLRTGGPAMLRRMSGPPAEPMKHDSAEGPNASAHVHPKVREYVCPMHPEVVSFRPGRCTKCGMSLQPSDAAVEE